MDCNANKVTGLLTEIFDKIYKKYNWYGDIEIDYEKIAVNTEASYIIRLNKFCMLNDLTLKYSANGYDNMVLINYIHALLCNNIFCSYSVNDLLYLEELVIQYHYMGAYYLKQINFKSISYKLDIKK